MESFWRMNQDSSGTESEQYDYRDHGGGFSDTAAKKGPWTAEEDEKLRKCVEEHGIGNWVTIEKRSGLGRTSKSCRLRWINHLRPHLKKGSFSVEEERLLVKMHKIYGNKWSYIASKMPGRTDNEIKNFWHGRVRRCHRKFLPIYPENIQDRDESHTYSLEMDGKNHQNDREFYDEHIHNTPSIFSPQGQSSSNLPSPMLSCAPQIPSPNCHSSIQQFQEQCMLSPQQSISNTSVAFTPMRPPPVLSPLVGHFKRFQSTCSPLSSPRTITQFPASESGSGSSPASFKINSVPSDLCSSNLNPQNLYTNSMPQSMAFPLPWDHFVSEPPSIQTPTSAYRPIPEMKTDIKLLNAPALEEQQGGFYGKKTKLSNPSDLLSRRLCRKFSDNQCIEGNDSMGNISRREGLLCEISKTGVLLVERGKKETILQGLLDKRSAQRISASKRLKTQDMGLEEGYKRWKLSGRNGIISKESSNEIMYRNPVEDVVPPGENLESLRSRFHEFKDSVSSLNDQDAFWEVPCAISRGQEDDFSTFDLEFCDMDVLKSGDEDDQHKCSSHTKGESSFSQQVQRGDFMVENLLDDGLLLLSSNDNQEILLEDIWNSIQPCRHEEDPSGQSLEKEVFTDNGCNEHSSQVKQQEMQEACNNVAEEMSSIPDWYDMDCEGSAIPDMVFELEMNCKDENSLGFQM